MKKFFSLFLSLVLVFFSLFCPSKTYAQTSPNVEVTSESCKNSSLSFDGIKNVVNHPFKILFRGLGWGILGALASIILPFSSNLVVTLGTICGILSKTIDLYLEGCNVK